MLEERLLEVSIARCCDAGHLEQTRLMVAAQALGIARAALESSPSTPTGGRHSVAVHRQQGLCGPGHPRSTPPDC